jgi:carbamate kinase
VSHGNGPTVGQFADWVIEANDFRPAVAIANQQKRQQQPHTIHP